MYMGLVAARVCFCVRACVGMNRVCDACVLDSHVVLYWLGIRVAFAPVFSLQGAMTP